MLKNFKIRIFLYLISILLVLLLSGYALFIAKSTSFLFVLIPVLVLLIWRLFRLVDKTNREIALFLTNIKYDDFEAHFSVSKNIAPSFQNLHSAFNEVTDKIRDIRSQKEIQFQYLQAIVEHVDTGLICFNEEGKTVLINKGLQQLLHKSYFPSLPAVEKFNPGLFAAMSSISPGERQLVKLLVGDQIVQLAVRKTILKLKDDALHLFAIQNIHAELEEQEVASWQKLIRILTHEIMNSVAPVVSLAATADKMLSTEEQLSEDSEEDIKKAIQAIYRRSQGLLHFTETYRKLTKVPPPKFQKCDPVEIIERVLILLQPELEKKAIRIDRQFKGKRYEAQLDPDLIEQVFINLVKNAIDALEDTEAPVIAIRIFRTREGELEIQIADNGPGISRDLLDEIFVPFFSTKKEGSGIGLSLSRQIMQLHKGNLSAYSQEGKGTVFTMKI